MSGTDPVREATMERVIARARQGDPDAGPDLLRLARDLLYPVNVRATALSMLAAYPGPETTQAMEIALMDEEALIRRTAVTSIFVPEMEKLAKLIAPMLYDPVKTVRIEAASRLSGDMAELLDKEQTEGFPGGLAGIRHCDGIHGRFCRIPSQSCQPV